jgi:hypothetical protein
LLYLKYIGIAGLKEWIIGSSIIKKALIEARKRPGGIQLVLTRLCMSLWWQGRSEEFFNPKFPDSHVENHSTDSSVQ